jgi:hypothetical protein
MRDFQNCETVSSDPSIVISDPGSRNNRSKFRLCNPRRASIKVVQVDDCVIKEGIRCDYLLVLPNGQELYVELKGSDVKHAVEQITRSIDLLACNCHPVDKLCFIASTRCPINSTEIQNLKKKFRQKYNAHLTIKNGEIIYSYDSE